MKLGKDYSLDNELAQAIDLAYQARKSGYADGAKVSGFARQQNLFPTETGETVADYTNAQVLLLADLLNDRRVGQLKIAIALYNEKAENSAAGQYDMFSGVIKTKEEILKEVQQILQYGTKQEQQSALDAATEHRKRNAVQQQGGGTGVQQTGAAGAGDRGSGGENTLGETGDSSELEDWFGPVYTQFEGKANEAEAHLRETTEGVAKGALVYPGVAPIDLVWGDMNAGYMKIVIKHPEVVGKLQDILSATTITSQSDNRIVFESDTHKMVVSRMKGQQPTDNWLLTAYEKKEKPVSASSSDIETEPEGKRNGTATPQNGALSAGKDTKNSATDKKNVADGTENVVPFRGETEKKQAALFEKVVEEARPVSEGEAALRDGLIDLMREAGMDVSADWEEGQRVLDEANGEAQLSQAKKRTLETARLNSQGEGTKGTVVSSDDGAKILKNLDILAKELENKSNNTKTFLGDVAKSLGAKQYKRCNGQN